MSILEVLKNENARLSCGWRWLVIDEEYSKLGEFVVYERKPNARKTKLVFRGTDERQACLALTED
jgi:hypothetical protein